uniref:Glycine cleavage system H protein n=2 Tax=Musa acuminata subsp. malaccensis TaxID=214687 RepID=A0A804HYU1_MUSAM
MNSFIKDLKYADTHEWVKVDSSSAMIGITRYPQGKNFGAVESVKATRKVNSPVSGEAVEVNTEPNGSPGLMSSLDKLFSTSTLFKRNNAFT